MTRKIRWLMIVVGVCLATALPVYAADARPQQQPQTYGAASAPSFIIGWYAMNHGPANRITFDLSAFDKLEAIHGSAKGTTLLMYTWGKNGAWFFKHIGHLLDTAHARGASVIMGLPIDYLTEPAPQKIHELAQAVSDNPGLLGWYSADEPMLNLARGWNDASPHNLRVAYKAIKAATDKPVFVCFTPVSLRPNAYPKYFKKPGHATIADYADTFDIFLIDPYPAHAGREEFAGMVSFMRSVHEAVRASHTVFKGKPWCIVAQAFGSGTGERHTQRLPTRDEYRFFVFWPIVNGAQGVVNYALHRDNPARYKNVPANKNKYAYARPGEPYPYDGQRWLKDVAAPVDHVLSAMQPALSEGAVPGAAMTNNKNVKTAVFVNGDSHDRWLLVANGSDVKVATDATLRLHRPSTTLEPVRFDQKSSSQTGLLISWEGMTGDVHLTLDPYEVAVFKLK